VCCISVTTTTRTTFDYLRRSETPEIFQCFRLDWWETTPYQRACGLRRNFRLFSAIKNNKLSLFFFGPDDIVCDRGKWSSFGTICGQPVVASLLTWPALRSTLNCSTSFPTPPSFIKSLSRRTAFYKKYSRMLVSL
jgi:hypothetical protein